MVVFLIAVGGALGALARFGLGGWVQSGVSGGFPWGTMIVNASGSLLLGFIMHLTERMTGSANWRALLAIGFCGAYTTFSTFSYETARLLQGRQWLAAAGNVTGNLLLSLTFVFLGFSTAIWFLKARG